MAILTYLLVAVVLAGLIIAAAHLLPVRHLYSEKVSAYESGFEPFGDARQSFDVHFYMVGIMFIVFDIEIAYLYPYAVTMGALGSVGFWAINVFFVILAVGFLYE